MNTEFTSRGDIRSEFTSEFFDSCSRAWLANKKRIGEGSYQYKCGVETCKVRVKGDAVNCRVHQGRGIDLNKKPPPTQNE